MSPWAKRAGLGIAGLLVGCLALEIGLRLFWTNPYRVPVASNSRSVVLRELERGANKVTRVDGGQVRFRTHTDGFIEPLLLSGTPRARVLFLGGSTTECASVDEPLRWPWLTVVGLTARWGPPVDHLNDGHAGNTARDCFELFYNKDEFFHPTHLVLLTGFNDLLYNMVSGGDFARMREDVPASLPASTWNWMGSHFYTAGLLQRIYDLRFNTPVQKSGGRLPMYDVPPAEFETPVRQFRKNLQLLVHYARGQKIQVLLLTQPSLYAADPKNIASCRYKDGLISMASMAVAMEKINQQIRQVAREEGAGLCDLDRDLPRTVENFSDEVHFTPAGCRKIADLVIAELLKP